MIATATDDPGDFYRIVGKLGTGGMGTVYEAFCPATGRNVALKFLSAELAGDPDASRRLLREAETVSSLSHPNICTVHSIDEYKGRRFIVMERLQGVNLKAFMAREPLTTARVVQVATQIARALEAAHGAGIVHRDIKPGNIIVGENGEVKVLDFGLARRFFVPDTGEVLEYGSTIPGRPLGTANYMAPERILQQPLDPRCDLFSLGVVMYEMATGRLPFAGASPGDTVTNVLDNEPTPIRKLNASHPATLERVISRLLKKDAADRYQSAGELLLALLTAGDRSPRWWQRLRG